MKENRESIDSSVAEGVKCKYENLLQKQMYINVACAVGPSVNKLRAQQIFPSKPYFCDFFKISETKSTQKSILFTP